MKGLDAVCSPDEADASGEHKEAVEVPDVHDLVDLVLREHGAADQQVQEQRPDAAVHVQHLGSGFRRRNEWNGTVGGSEMETKKTREGLQQYARLRVNLCSVADGGEAYIVSTRYTRRSDADSMKYQASETTCARAVAISLSANIAKQTPPNSHKLRRQCLRKRATVRCSHPADCAEDSQKKLRSGRAAPGWRPW